MAKFKYAYAIVSKENHCCTQVNKNNKPNWILDNDYCFNIPLSVDVASQYIDKYYYNNAWWSRVWNEYTVNEYGENVPVESAGYVDYEWTPVVGE